MRDYETMRAALAIAASARDELHYNDFRDAGQDDQLENELARLSEDRLIEGDIHFSHGFGERSRCNVSGLTPKGLEFYRLIENEEVWLIIRDTLRKAGVDISYPLLKEVCEEIVKRYVTSFIPEVPKRR